MDNEVAIKIWLTKICSLFTNSSSPPHTKLDSLLSRPSNHPPTQPPVTMFPSVSLCRVEIEIFVPVRGGLDAQVFRFIMVIAGSAIVVVAAYTYEHDDYIGMETKKSFQKRK